MGRSKVMTVSMQAAAVRVAQRDENLSLEEIAARHPYLAEGVAKVREETAPTAPPREPVRSGAREIVSSLTQRPTL